MVIEFTKEKAKNWLSCELCTKYTLTTEVDGKKICQAYYGYPKRRAISEFKKHVKIKTKEFNHQ
jgi:hypothetical protein